MVARSSVEAGFKAMEYGVRSCKWTSQDENYTNYLEIKWEEQMRLYRDNKFIINIVHNPVQHDWTKHVK